MDPLKIEELITDSKRLTSIFGHWPTFHDAEITELHFERGEISETTNTWEFPVLTIKVILWALTSRVSADGVNYFDHQTLASLQFREIDQFSMHGFNYQNAIYGLEIKQKQNGDRWTFQVEIDPAFGMGSKFECGEICVLNAIPWDRDKRPPAWVTRETLSALGSNQG